MLTRLAAALDRHRCDHVLRIAIDGPDAAGKTTLADGLARLIERPVIRVGVDGFHRPAADRLRRGSLSPEGYYRDSFDHDLIVERVLRPLGPGGDGRYLPALWDYRSEQPVRCEPQVAEPGSVLLFDGVFLLRPELCEHWDVSVYLDVSPAETLRRALVRDLDLFGSAEVVTERYRTRYLPGQELYRREADPLARADVVLGMDDLASPVVVRWFTGAAGRS